ncbi:MAG: hypothetical protein AAF763_11075 [Pseudomonadota bacterium]
MEGLEFSQIFNAMLASIVFPVVVGILNRVAERGTSKHTKARLELVGESLAVLEKLRAAAAGRPDLAGEAERFEAVIKSQCADLFEDLDARHAAFRRQEAGVGFRFLPTPQGVFGRIWWFLALAFACFAVLMSLLLVVWPTEVLEDEPDFYVVSIFQIFLVALMAALFRAAAFWSARLGESDAPPDPSA